MQSTKLFFPNKIKKKKNSNIYVWQSFNTDATSSSALISDSDDDPDEDSIDSVYLHYDFNQREINQNLPISVYKSRILRAIKENPILILQGATGCGKTTQVHLIKFRNKIFLFLSAIHVTHRCPNIY